MARQREKLSYSEDGSLAFPPFLLAVLTLFFLARSAVLVRVLYRKGRYRRMPEKERMLFLYCEIIGMMGKLDPDFCPDHPFEISEEEGRPFDPALYRRTVERMEKLVYGKRKPEAGEVFSAEILAGQLKSALRKRRWRRRCRRRNGSPGKA